ncbi:MAG: hypothetical protein HY908_33740 [Myxococcales bacterium]|nr:hypothetical protein [Myxococcales bacterium]
MRSVAWLALGCVLAPLAGCAAEREFVNEDPSWSQQGEIDTGALRQAESLFGDDGKDWRRFVLRGVRHDLALRADAAPDAQCACLDAAVGDTHDARFQWSGEVPDLSPDQLVVALRRSEGPGCPPMTYGVDVKRLSIAAVDIWEPHVVVVVEELAYDRPQALGAIVRKPQPGGALYLRPRTPDKEYGKAPNAPKAGAPAGVGTMCRLHVRRDEGAPSVRPTGVRTLP